MRDANNPQNTALAVLNRLVNRDKHRQISMFAVANNRRMGFTKPPGLGDDYKILFAFARYRHAITLSEHYEFGRVLIVPAESPPDLTHLDLAPFEADGVIFAVADDPTAYNASAVPSSAGIELPEPERPNYSLVFGTVDTEIDIRSVRSLVEDVATVVESFSELDEP